MVTATMTTDASKTGWGAVLNMNQQEILQFALQEKTLNLRSSNQREARAILYALRRFKKQLMKANQLNILTDKQEPLMNIQRKAAASILVQTIRKILDEAQKMGIVVNATHIKVIYNRKTDALSRLELSADYEIRIKFLNMVPKSQDLKQEADMFATKYNKKCPIYYVSRSDEETAGEGYLQADQNNKTILINSLLTLMGKIVRKLFTVKNCIAIVIVTEWVNQWWSNQLKDLATQTVILGNSERVFKEGRSMKRRRMKLPPGQVLVYVTRIGEVTLTSKNQLQQSIQLLENSSN
ncbi:MAG: hypothetical protein EZS28_003839 [Streblomastix strix]|uniref:Reverse transcriptase RNase H-like domain-containing protein n=1 Tax=Streblomastix strix TaxID=222440 RepID=A0A5J4X1I3_9EUKA|nr:MAG: hypothetical protein EZS28_003839 [Streblomastix strix]